jgi:hypothetical protein
MEKEVAEKYGRLREACYCYPKIVLSGIEERGGYLNSSKKVQLFKEPKKHAKNGFIEKFCL